jgi:hypothetical protein
MSNLTIGFLAGVGFAAWVYSKMMRSTGSNIKNSVIVAAIAGIFVMVLVNTLLGIFAKN